MLLHSRRASCGKRFKSKVLIARSANAYDWEQQRERMQRSSAAMHLLQQVCDLRTLRAVRCFRKGTCHLAELLNLCHMVENTGHVFRRHLQFPAYQQHVERTSREQAAAPRHTISTWILHRTSVTGLGTSVADRKHAFHPRTWESVERAGYLCYVLCPVGS